MTISGNQPIPEKRELFLGNLELSNEFLETFAIVCEDSREIVPRFAERYAELVDTWQCTVDLADPGAQGELVRGVQGLSPDNSAATPHPSPLPQGERGADGVGED